MSDTRPLGKRAPAPAPAGPRRFRGWSAGRPVDTTLRRDIPKPLAPVLRH